MTAGRVLFNAMNPDFVGDYSPGGDYERYDRAAAAVIAYHEATRLQSLALVGGGVVPELTEEDIKRCLRSTGLREDEDGPANTYYRDGLEDGYALAASRLPALKEGEVGALEIVRRIAETKLEEDDDDYEMDVDIAFAKLSEIVNDCRDALRAQATTERGGT